MSLDEDGDMAVCMIMPRRVPSNERVVSLNPRQRIDKLAGFYLGILHRLLSLDNPEVAIGQCRCGN